MNCPPLRRISAPLPPHAHSPATTNLAPLDLVPLTRNTPWHAVHQLDRTLGTRKNSASNSHTLALLARAAAALGSRNLLVDRLAHRSSSPENPPSAPSSPTEPASTALRRTVPPSASPSLGSAWVERARTGATGVGFLRLTSLDSLFVAVLGLLSDYPSPALKLFLPVFPPAPLLSPPSFTFSRLARDGPLLNGHGFRLVARRRRDGHGRCRVLQACFLTPSWRIRSTADYIGTLIGVFSAVVLLEFVRRLGREYDRSIRAWYNRREERALSVLGKTTSNLDLRTAGGEEEGVKDEVVVQVPPFRPTNAQHLLRTTFHLIQFSTSYILMLLAMYFNGGVIFAILLGGAVGYGRRRRKETLEPVIGRFSCVLSRYLFRLFEFCNVVTPLLTALLQSRRDCKHAHAQQAQYHHNTSILTGGQVGLLFANAFANPPE
ncbi:Ctr copper transporter family protein [Rhodotorula toruloides ATCC 204091]|uniref:Copper transport protein n=1 Tax=Rhodotorula toruloides TaxID=5286 RepID=A0A2T0A6M8_RHOTO|nr:Ctr copper transporter family protein [Rhodotorula toruloides ATCC 204091]PRQ73650.1 Ctr copper transporter family protein [Rhodotorula toruloides]